MSYTLLRITAVNDKKSVTWDISGLQHCRGGKSCPPVSLDLAAQGFRVPECAKVVTSVKKTAGRGKITVPVHPSSGNAYRGEVEFSDDGFDGRQVYTAIITVRCSDKKQTGGRHYVYVAPNPFTGGKTWHDAQDHCLGLGMTLASIHDKLDQAAALQASGGAGGWIGLTDDNHEMVRDSCPGAPGCASVRSSVEGKFVFTDGTFIGELKGKKWVPQRNAFSNWGTNEPNEYTNANKGGGAWKNGEDCVMMKGKTSSKICGQGKGSGCWNDNACDGKRGFICGPKTHGVRLACDNTIGTGTCHQGRIEVLNPFSLKWGTVCGHHIWNNDHAAGTPPSHHTHTEKV